MITLTYFYSYAETFTAFHATMSGKRPSQPIERSKQVEKDDRFKHVHSDPRFAPMAKASKQVKLDKRFAGMLNDKDFEAVTAVDKFGRTVKVKGRDTSKEYIPSEELEEKVQKKSQKGEDRAQPKKGASFASKQLQSADGSESDDDDAGITTTKSKAKKQLDAKTKAKMEMMIKQRKLAQDAHEQEEEEESGSTSIGSTGDEADETIFMSDGDDDDDTEGVTSKNLIKKQKSGVHKAADESDVDDMESDEEYRENGAVKLPGTVAGQVADVVEKPTKRLAIMNMDWSIIRSVDLLTLFRSAAPPGGLVKKVSIYSSEFGRQRMEHEIKYGPQFGMMNKNKNNEESKKGNANKKSISDDEDNLLEDEEMMMMMEEDEDEDGMLMLDEDEDIEGLGGDDEEGEEGENTKPSRIGKAGGKKGGKNSGKQGDDAPYDPDAGLEVEDADEMEVDRVDKVDMDALRNYELDKLKYYFAVAECDSPETAFHLYNELDGVEYERSANVMDLRFIPDHHVFKREHIRDTASRVPSNYTAPQFTTNALQLSNVKCTWDQEDPRRAKLLRHQHFTKVIED